ncbi:MAG: MFS transporter [Terriglobales bacterium]
MAAIPSILRGNLNYRRLWLAQVVSEMGDWFNQVAVFTVALHYTGSAVAISYVLMSQTIPAVVIGPLAGVVLDRVNRRHALIVSDVVRAVVALGPILVTSQARVWWLYPLTVLLASASPFFNAGRLALIPTIAAPEEILAANSVTQATHSTTLGVGSALAGLLIAPLGFRNAFILNALSFAASAYFISRIRLARATSAGAAAAALAPTVREVRSYNEAPAAPVVALPTAAAAPRPHRRAWREYSEGLRYIRREPLVLGLLLIGVGWATGGGAMQVLFSIFGDLVFHRGAFGIGMLYGAAGLGLALSAAAASWFGPKLSFTRYKRLIAVCYLLYGTFYVLFSQERGFWTAVLLIGLSRYFIGTSSVLNLTRLMRIVPDAMRGRVFATNETMTLSTMLISMLIAGVATTRFGARDVALAAGLLSGSTAIWWSLANWLGKLREPRRYAL